MKGGKKNEDGSTTADLATKMGNTTDLALLQGFGKVNAKYRAPETSLQRLKRKAKKKKHENIEDSFENQCIKEALNEVVRKRGSTWVLFDDHTGVEVGAYKDRKTAWSKQRVRRTQDKYKHVKKKKKKQATAFTDLKNIANKHNVKSNAFTFKKAKQHESFLSGILENLLNERVEPYVFEQSPTDSFGWDNFISRLSHETMQSDPKLKNLLDGVHKAKLKVLEKSCQALKKTIEGVGDFIVSKPKVQNDENKEPIMEFTIEMPEANKKLAFIVKSQHNRPVLSIPEMTKSILNNTASDESKLLRAELMHVQETVLDNFDELKKAAEKRDNYLKTIEKNLDKTVNAMVPMQIAMLKNLLKAKYKGIK